MLHKDDMMLGNYVAISGQIAKVRELLQDTLRVEMKDGAILSASYDDVNALAFTQDILKMFGFEQHKYKFSNGRSEHYRLYVRIGAQGSNNHFEITFQEDGKVRGAYLSAPHDVTEPFDTVHQFQNLFRSVMRQPAKLATGRPPDYSGMHNKVKYVHP